MRCPSQPTSNGVADDIGALHLHPIKKIQQFRTNLTYLDERDKRRNGAEEEEQPAAPPKKAPAPPPGARAKKVCTLLPPPPPFPPFFSQPAPLTCDQLSLSLASHKHLKVHRLTSVGRSERRLGLDY